MNLILMQTELPPTVVANEHRRTYLETLRQADTGNLAPFVVFSGQAAETTLRTLLHDLNG